MVEQIAANDSTGAEPVVRKPKQARSTIKFPYYDLDAAIGLVRTIHETRGARTSLDDLIGVLPNYSTARSGAFRQLIAAAVQFGLVDAAGREVILTNRAYQVLSDDDDEQRRGQAEAFLAVPLFQAIFTEYRGRTLPPQVGMLRTIEHLGVVDSLSDRAYGTFIRSAEQAGFFEAGGRQYLVQPTLRRGGSAPGAPESSTAVRQEATIPTEVAPAAKAGGSPPTGIHPAIMGLLQLLPPEGNPFPETSRRTWLQAIGGALDLIYGTEVQPTTLPIETGGDKTE
jgi:hypothetical protein